MGINSKPDSENLSESRKKPKSDMYFIAFVVVMVVVLTFVPTGFENPALTESILYEKAVVIEIDNSYLNSYSIVTTGNQNVKIVVKSGPFKGDTLVAQNVLLGQKSIDKIFGQGDKVLAILQLDGTRETVTGARAADYYRHGVEILLFACFALFLVLFAKFTGFKAILSFIFTAFAFWKFLIPMYLKGFSPLLCSLSLVFMASIVIILLVGGLTKKGFVALFGTMAGVGITAVLAEIFGHFLKIPGTVQEFSETLLYAGFVDLNLSEIFISVIFISSAGALMDVAMDISAAQNEIVAKIPDIPKGELIKSGFRIASPVMGTMTTTLLFAYTGSFMFAFMAFMAQGTPFLSIVNTSYISAEILHTLVGSFGLVLVAPLTAIIGGLIYTKRGG